MPVPCARCDSPLPLHGLTDGVATCGACGTRNTVRLFPALAAAPSGPAVPESALAGEAACFDHPSKRAVAACQQCGRFVCQLCRVDFGDRTWCPACVAADRGRGGRAAYLETARVMYDSIALAVPMASLIFWPLTVITGPGTVVFSAMTWKRPLSLVRKRRWRFVVAMLIGILETVGWIWLVVYAWEQYRIGLNGAR